MTNPYADYDAQARANHWHAEVIFGLCYEYIHPGERLLDMGIGTGPGAEPFVRAGLRVHGVDSSPEMLALCAAKGIAVDLKQHDLQVTPWPYPAGMFDHLIACGVLHFIADLGPVFREAGRLLRPGGTFAFTTKAPPAGMAFGESYAEEVIQGTTLYLHPREHIARVAAGQGFEVVKEVRLLITTGRQTEDVFPAYVTRQTRRE